MRLLFFSKTDQMIKSDHNNNQNSQSVAQKHNFIFHFEILNLFLGFS